MTRTLQLTPQYLSSQGVGSVEEYQEIMRKNRLASQQRQQEYWDSHPGSFENRFSPGTIAPGQQGKLDAEQRQMSSYGQQQGRSQDIMSYLKSLLSGSSRY